MVVIYKIAATILLKIVLTIAFNKAIEIVPELMSNLDDEDVSFIKKFIMASGSLKEIANLYGVVYPIVRLRLDKHIQKNKFMNILLMSHILH